MKFNFEIIGMYKKRIHFARNHNEWEAHLFKSLQIRALI